MKESNKKFLILSIILTLVLFILILSYVNLSKKYNLIIDKYGDKEAIEERCNNPFAVYYDKISKVLGEKFNILRNDIGTLILNKDLNIAYLSVGNDLNLQTERIVLDEGSSNNNIDGYTTIEIKSYIDAYKLQLENVKEINWYNDEFLLLTDDGVVHILNFSNILNKNIVFQNIKELQDITSIYEKEVDKDIFELYAMDSNGIEYELSKYLN